MALYQYAIGTGTKMTGTVTVASGTPNTLTGSGTAFVTELAAGYHVVCNGNYLTIASVGNDTTANLTDASVTAGSTDAYVLRNLDTLTTPLKMPKHYYRPYVDLIDLGNGLNRGMGLPVASWTWGFVTRAQRDQLRTYCTTTSARVAIYTRINDSAEVYDAFLAAMLWPDEADKQAGRRLNFVVNFRDMVQLTA